MGSEQQMIKIPPEGPFERVEQSEGAGGGANLLTGSVKTSFEDNERRSSNR